MLAKDGLEAQLLARVVARERPDLQQAKTDLTTQGAEHRRLLQEIERKILNVLSTSEHLLEDEEAVQVGYIFVSNAFVNVLFPTVIIFFFSAFAFNTRLYYNVFFLMRKFAFIS